MNHPSGKNAQNINRSRRVFLNSTAAASAAWLSGRLSGDANCTADEVATPAEGKLKITIAGYAYDRVSALIDGRVQVDRCETAFETGRIGEMNTHVFSEPQTRDVTGNRDRDRLLPYILAFANEEFRDYRLIPVFPLRTFRHKSIFIRTDRDIAKPSDLRGKTVATPGYSSTSLTWIRGILQHEYGVRPEEIQWVVSAKESSAQKSGGASKFENASPKGINIRQGPEGKDESQLLVDGDVDALFHAAEPLAFQQGHPKVARLFTDARKTEQQYFAKTGIFPIMHAVAIRKDLFETQPWLPKAVFRAYSEAKQLNYDEIKQHAWFMSSLPWIAQEAEATRKLMGDNYYSYGIAPNRKALDALLLYAHEQGLAKRKLKIDELFPASTLELREHASPPSR